MNKEFVAQNQDSQAKEKLRQLEDELKKIENALLVAGEYLDRAIKELDELSNSVSSSAIEGSGALADALIVVRQTWKDIVTALTKSERKIQDEIQKINEADPESDDFLIKYKGKLQ